MQVSEHDAGFRRATDDRVGLFLENLFLLFLLLCGSWNHVEFRLQAAIRDPVVLHFDEVLDVVFLLWTFNTDRTALDLYDSIIFDVDFPRKAL